MKNNVLLLLFTCSWITLFAQTKISPEEAYKHINKKPNKVQLLDVRTTKEYASKHIKNAISADWTNPEVFEQAITKLSKKKPLYVYCLSGGRSAKAVKILAEKGFNVIEIEGGIMNWESNNLPLEELSKPIAGLTKKALKNIAKQHDIVLIDFYATWCGPCKEIEPHIKYIQQAYNDKVHVLKIDVDQNMSLTKQLGIRSIPYLMILKKGKVTWKNAGVVELESILKEL